MSDETTPARDARDWVRRRLQEAAAAPPACEWLWPERSWCVLEFRDLPRAGAAGPWPLELTLAERGQRVAGTIAIGGQSQGLRLHCPELAVTHTPQYLVLASLRSQERPAWFGSFQQLQSSATGLQLVDLTAETTGSWRIRFAAGRESVPRERGPAWLLELESREPARDEL